MLFRIRKLLKVAFVISLCVGLSIETDNSTESKEDAANKGKSRKKRRGCKCVQRYMTEVDKMIDTKLKEFRDVYLATPLNEKKDTEAARMRDALLRLSGDVAETKNTLRVLTTNMESVLEDLNNTQKDYTKISKQLNRISGAVANLTKYVDNLEQRIVYPPNEITVGNDLETSTIPKPMPTREYSLTFFFSNIRFPASENLLNPFIKFKILRTNTNGVRYTYLSQKCSFDCDCHLVYFLTLTGYYLISVQKDVFIANVK